MKRKTLLVLPVLLLAVSMFAVAVIAQVEVEAIVIGKGFVVVDGIKTSGRAVLDVDLTPTLDVKFAFGDYVDVDGAEDWLYGWNITNVVTQGQVTEITAVPSEVGDGTVPGPVPIRIFIRSFAEGRTVGAMGSDFATGAELRFSGRIEELENVGV